MKLSGILRGLGDIPLVIWRWTV